MPLQDLLGRVLAMDIRASQDVPGFTRSDRDGFAVQAADTFGCGEETPRVLTLNSQRLASGVEPEEVVESGTATSIATGGVLPRGADAVVMLEDTSFTSGGGEVEIRRPVAPCAHLTQAGADIARGEMVLRRGTVLTSRETGVLAALGLDRVKVLRRPRVAILSTGNELVLPGGALAPGQIHDANGTILAHAVEESGGLSDFLGIAPDDPDQVEAALSRGLETADMVLLSGGTSKGAGDVNVAAVKRLGPPGVLVHGVALRPGKPVCLAVCNGKPVIVLPGFPTSALFTFHEFAAPVIRSLAGRRALKQGRSSARLPRRINSVVGRTEYILVGLVRGAEPESVAADSTAAPDSAGGGLVAVPLGKGSGSVTSFGAADGFISIDRDVEYLPAGANVEVTLLSRRLTPADLVLVGSHCLGLDIIIDALTEKGVRTRFFPTGSLPGLEALKDGHADAAGLHLLDPGSHIYNRPFLAPGMTFLEGYRRMQGLVFRHGDERFSGKSLDAALAEALAAAGGAVFINRNRGSGTRVLIDEILADARPPGFMVEARSHHAVAAAVAQGRADWGLAIENVARLHDLGFI
ncbi:MAG: molybdopterin biosynthesis protein, partial [Acidobacteriota bacterium]